MSQSGLFCLHHSNLATITISSFINERQIALFLKIYPFIAICTIVERLRDKLEKTKRLLTNQIRECDNNSAVVRDKVIALDILKTPQDVSEFEHSQSIQIPTR